MCTPLRAIRKANKWRRRNLFIVPWPALMGISYNISVYKKPIELY